MIAIQTEDVRHLQQIRGFYLGKVKQSRNQRHRKTPRTEFCQVYLALLGIRFVVAKRNMDVWRYVLHPGNKKTGNKKRTGINWKCY